MKKIINVLLFTVVLLLATQSESFAQNKFGYFDLDKVVSSMPGFSDIDGLMGIYESDSVAAEYNSRISEIKGLQLIFKTDSARLSPDERQVQRQRITQALYIIENWEKYLPIVLQEKQKALLKPFKTKALAALQEVITEGKYTYVFKMEGLWNAPPADNLMIPVAKKLGLKIPEEQAK